MVHERELVVCFQRVGGLASIPTPPLSPHPLRDFPDTVAEAGACCVIIHERWRNDERGREREREREREGEGEREREKGRERERETERSAERTRERESARARERKRQGARARERDRDYSSRGQDVVWRTCPNKSKSRTGTRL